MPDDAGCGIETTGVRESRMRAMEALPARRRFEILGFKELLEPGETNVPEWRSAFPVAGSDGRADPTEHEAGLFAP